MQRKTKDDNQKISEGRQVAQVSRWPEEKTGVYLAAHAERGEERGKFSRSHPKFLEGRKRNRQGVVNTI